MTLFATMGASTSNSVSSVSCVWNLYMCAREMDGGDFEVESESETTVQWHSMETAEPSEGVGLA